MATAGQPKAALLPAAGVVVKPHMPTRLETEAPEFARFVSEAVPAVRDRTVLRVIRALALQIPELAPLLIDILDRSDSGAAAALAERLDEKYFELEEQGDTAAETAFVHARAAMAARFALMGNGEEALYEAMVAINDETYIQAVFKRALRDEA